ncbi:cytochrome P450 [Streptomyces sp. CHD11]|uniref:cytochrome P450 family protein n=1 Tax=Streptomyces sp. CHD11 TaxID=2741325 RepID=UPI00204051D0|nr:cytochrome P450 [Streptomyces sp. CHD11]MBT3153134.1 cytochrome P450 [Streptomyces sp. CHD11]
MKRDTEEMAGNRSAQNIPLIATDPHAAYEHLREQAPACPIRSVEGSLMWIVAQYGGVRSVLGDARFANNPASVPDGKAPLLQINAMRRLGLDEELIPYLADTLLDSDGKEHSRLRRLVTPAFSARKVKALSPRIERLTDDLLDALPRVADAGVADLLEHFAYPLPITVIGELVGVPATDLPAWLRWTHDLSFNQQALGETLRPLIDHTHDLVRLRRAEPGEDVISDLIRARDADGDRLSDRELVTMVLSLVIAGHDTTANFIANSVWALLTHPDQLALLRDDPGLMPQAVQELLRWCGPVLVSRMRYATEDVDLGWTSFETGDAVTAALSGANHDPREFEDPGRLDITRQHSSRGEVHVSFGSGPHYCLGAALARQEAETALSRLLARHPDLALAVPAEELQWHAVSGMRKLARLPVRL